MTKIFLSYRRGDSAGVTGRIDDRLVDAFGREAVFKDIDSIPLGVDFRTYLADAVGGCNVVLVVMGEGWLGAEDEAGNRRLEDDADFVRIEVEAALQRKIPVVPVLLGNAQMPKPEDLPKPMRELSFRNATKVRPDPDFNPDMSRIVDSIKKANPQKTQQPSSGSHHKSSVTKKATASKSTASKSTASKSTASKSTASKSTASAPKSSKYQVKSCPKCSKPIEVNKADYKAGKYIICGSCGTSFNSKKSLTSSSSASSTNQRSTKIVPTPASRINPVSGPQKRPPAPLNKPVTRQHKPAASQNFQPAPRKQQSAATSSHRAKSHRAMSPRKKRPRKLLRLFLFLFVLCALGGAGWYFSPPEIKEAIQAQIAKLTGRSPAEPQTFTNSNGMAFKRIPAGTFMMGSPDSEEDRSDDEVQHEVTITRDYYLGITEVTQSHWQKVMGTTPWKGKAGVKEGEDFPASYISWNEANDFCQKLSEQDGGAYRLPTEAEWEYACRAGTTTRFSFGNDESQLKEFAWYAGNSEEHSHPVAVKRPNGFGLYDMHGNMWEYCRDWRGDYPDGSITDPVGPSEGTKRVLRGACWHETSSAPDCRSASRGLCDLDARWSNFGFRVLLVPDTETSHNTALSSNNQALPKHNASPRASIVKQGSLDENDSNFNEGEEYYDEYTFNGSRGQKATIDLRSDDFDTYLILTPPEGEILVNDDRVKPDMNSLVEHDLVEDGEYRVRVTSNEPGETGGYELKIRFPGSPDREQIDLAGSLKSDDPKLDDGESVKDHKFNGSQGEKVVIDLKSEEFDTYLILIGSDGKRIGANDDRVERDQDSLLELDLVDGEYKVWVTSNKPGEKGDYELNISFDK